MGLVKDSEERAEEIVEKARKKWNYRSIKRRNSGVEIDIAVKDSRNEAPDPESGEGMLDPKVIGASFPERKPDSERGYWTWTSDSFNSAYRDDNTPKSQYTSWGGCPNGNWPLTTFVEETEEYILMCCDAGCTVTFIKKPPSKKQNPDKKLMIVNGELVDSSSVKIITDVPIL